MEPTRARLATPLLVAAALFVAAGGYVHLREWLDGYRDVPADIPGSALVRLGFPIHAVASSLAAGILLWLAARRRAVPTAILVAPFALQAASLLTVILTRTGSVLGWSEPTWTRGAEQSRATSIGAMLCIAAAASVAGSFSRAGTLDRSVVRPAAGAR